jgi:predicted molibdopterin-dependent oxidoreductase YjgC
MERIKNHPILDFKREEKVTFEYNGQKIKAYKGETIAAALHAAGIKKLKHSPKKERPRGLFCAIGNCSSCLMEVDGVPNVKTCVTKVKEGMVVREQKGHGDL